MTDQSAPANPAPGPGGAPTLRALSQFVKDLSFENPANPLPDGQPNIDIGIDVSAAPRDDGQGVFETSLKLTAHAHIGEATLFLMELDYCGLFQVLGLSQQDTEAALLIECPRMLFPFARRLVADITREGGFPPLLIDPVDFVHLYRQQRQRQDQEGGVNVAASGPPAGAAPQPAPASETPGFTPHTPPPPQAPASPEPAASAEPPAPQPASVAEPQPMPQPEPTPPQAPSPVQPAPGAVPPAATPAPDAPGPDSPAPEASPAAPDPATNDPAPDAAPDAGQPPQRPPES